MIIIGVRGHRLHGKVDDVPNLFYVKTMFRHAYFVPFIPVGSYLLLYKLDPSGNYQGVQIPLRWKSIFITWFRMVTGLFIAIFASLSIAFLTGGPRIVWHIVGLCAFASLALICLYAATYCLQKASYSRKLELAQLLEISDEELDNAIQRSRGTP
jgi:hypothetical protein